MPGTTGGGPAPAPPIAADTPVAHSASELTVQVAPEAISPTARMLEVGLRFGIPLTSPARTIVDRLPIDLKPGTLVLLTGPSGAGKSQLLQAVGNAYPHSRLVHAVPFPTDVAVLDAVAPGRPLDEALALLTACGLGEPMLWIRKFNQLSDGERFRARLARAISLQRREPGHPPLLCDEFTAILHRRLAKALAFNLRKLVTREQLRLVVATSQEDLAGDLHPDLTVTLDHPVTGNPPTVTAAPPGLQTSYSLLRRLRIDRGSTRDYEQFSPMHYRQRDQLGFVDRVFVLREMNGPALGIIVYGHAALEITLRNRVTSGRFTKRPHRLNRELRVIKRLVMHPDVRGCGLGHWLVERTLPLAGVRFVECLAAMGAINPVFDKAGMRRVGTITPPAARERTLLALRAAGADPLAADFAQQVTRRPAVRRMVSASVLDWYRCTTSLGPERIATMTPLALAQTFRQMAGSQPVYFIWAADQKGKDLIHRRLEPDDEDG